MCAPVSVFGQARHDLEESSPCSFCTNTAVMSVHRRTWGINGAPIREVMIDLNMNSHMLRLSLPLSPDHGVWLLEKIDWRQCKPLEGYCLTQLTAREAKAIFLVRHAGFKDHKNNP